MTAQYAAFDPVGEVVSYPYELPFGTANQHRIQTRLNMIGDPVTMSFTWHVFRQGDSMDFVTLITPSVSIGATGPEFVSAVRSFAMK